MKRVKLSIEHPKLAIMLTPVWKRLSQNYWTRREEGMLQGGCGLGFADETLPSDLILLEFGRQEFQGDFSVVQRQILGKVNFSHPTLAEFLDDPVMSNALTNQCSRPHFEVRRTKEELRNAHFLL